MICIFFAAWSVFASEILDTDMTAQEKKQTGVYKLSDTEKASLQQWIDTHYQKKGSEPAAQIEPNTSTAGKHPTLSENLYNSQYLRLSDGTLWNVRPQDVPVAQGWITPTEIIISQSGNPFFPTKLTNKVSGSSIFARKAQDLPQTAPAPNIDGQSNAKIISPSKPQRPAQPQPQRSTPNKP